MEKTERVLILFYRLLKKERIHKASYALECQMTIRSVERDIQTIRFILSELYTGRDVLFDRQDESYYLSDDGQESLSGMEVTVLLKVLLGSRSLRQDEMMALAGSIRKMLPARERKKLSDAIKDEVRGYIGPMHGKALIKMQWDLTYCISRQQKICLQYSNKRGEAIQRKVLPLNLVFSEYYFYLVAMLDGTDYEYPAFFRLDRIHSFRVLPEKFSQMLYEKYRFSQMGSTVQFMYAGKLQNVVLKCRPDALEALQDRIPKHRILQRDAQSVLLEAQVFGEGFLHWLAMQGNSVELIEPAELREKFRCRLEEVLGLYKVTGGNQHG